MFDNVGVLAIDVYDGITSQYLGKTTFPLTPSSKRAFLQIVNGEETPRTIILQDVSFFKTARFYTPPDTYEKYKQIGIVHAVYRDSDSGLWIPIDIYMRSNVRTTGYSLNGEYHFEIMEHSGILIEDVRFIPYGTYLKP